MFLYFVIYAALSQIVLSKLRTFWGKHFQAIGLCKKLYLASLGFSFITIGSFSSDIGDIVNKSDTGDTEYT